MNRIIICLLMILFAQTNGKRVLSLYTMNEHNAAYLAQLHILEKDPAGLKERDIAIEKFVYNKNNAHLFKAHHITGEFVVTLTGKDGGEKHRADKPVTLSGLYGLIDAMPMRKAEMKEKKN